MQNNQPNIDNLTREQIKTLNIIRKFIKNDLTIEEDKSNIYTIYKTLMDYFADNAEAKDGILIMSLNRYLQPTRWEIFKDFFAQVVQTFIPAYKSAKQIKIEKQSKFLSALQDVESDKLETIQKQVKTEVNNKNKKAALEFFDSDNFIITPSSLLSEDKSGLNFIYNIKDQSDGTQYFFKKLERSCMGPALREVAKATIVGSFIKVPQYYIVTRGGEHYVASRGIKNAETLAQTLVQVAKEKNLTNTYDFLFQDENAHLLKQYIYIQELNAKLGNYDAHLNNILFVPATEGKPSKLVAIDFDATVSYAGLLGYQLDFMEAAIEAGKTQLVNAYTAEVRTEIAQEISKPKNLCDIEDKLNLLIGGDTIVIQDHNSLQELIQNFNTNHFMTNSDIMIEFNAEDQNWNDKTIELLNQWISNYISNCIEYLNNANLNQKDIKVNNDADNINSANTFKSLREKVETLYNESQEKIKNLKKQITNLHNDYKNISTTEQNTGEMISVEATEIITVGKQIASKTRKYAKEEEKCEAIKKAHVYLEERKKKVTEIENNIKALQKVKQKLADIRSKELQGPSTSTIPTALRSITQVSSLEKSF